MQQKANTSNQAGKSQNRHPYSRTRRKDRRSQKQEAQMPSLKRRDDDIHYVLELETRQTM